MARPKSAAKDDIRQLSGAERSAILMLSLGEEHSAVIWEMMDDDEIKEVSQVMSTLGAVNSTVIEKLLVDFVSQISGTGSLMGSYESTERMLARILPGDKVGQFCGGQEASRAGGKNGGLGFVRRVCQRQARRHRNLPD